MTGLARFTAKTDCRLTRVATIRSQRQEVHFCAACSTTLITEIGDRAVCQVLLGAQRSRAASDEATQGVGA